MRAQNDFDYSLLDTTAHRPWPLPGSPWIMTQTWHDLLFAHWPVPIERLRPLVPPPLPVDTYEGQAWLGIIPFGMTNVAPRGVPALPGVSAFEELNVRTYVTLDGKPGIYFFSLDASNPVAVRAARWFFHLPYYSASMTREMRNAWIRFRSHRTDSESAAELECQYCPTGPPEASRPGTLEHFLTERYCLYTLDRRRRPCRLEIHHKPWPLQSADAAFDLNSMAAANGLSLPLSAPLLHYAKRQDTIAWALARL